MLTHIADTLSFRLTHCHGPKKIPFAKRSDTNIPNPAYQMIVSIRITQKKKDTDLSRCPFPPIALQPRRREFQPRLWKR